MPIKVTKTYIRSGASFARGTAIEAVLSEEDSAAIHDRWKNAWGEKLDCGGGVTSITCEMVAAVPYAELISVYGKRRIERIFPIISKYNIV